MNKIISSLLLAALALPPLAQASEWKSMDAGKSTLTFVFRQMGVPVDGRFQKFSAQMNFDPTRLAAANASIDLDLASIDAGSDEANDAIVGKPWFDVKEYPRAKFISNAVRPLGANRYQVDGKITIKGHTRDVSAPFTFAPQGESASFDGSFVLKRADFAIGDGIWADFDTVANEIEIRFHFLAHASK